MKEATWSSCEWAPGRKVYGRNAAEIQERVAAAKAGRAITGPQPPWLNSAASGAGSPDALSATRPAARPTRHEPALNAQNLPVFLGPVIGIPAIGQVFNSRFGQTVLSGLPVEGTPVSLNGKTIAEIGDGTAKLATRGDRLVLALCRKDLAAAVESVEAHELQFEADWQGAPDRWELRDGARVAIIDEWAIGPIFMTCAESSRNVCAVL